MSSSGSAILDHRQREVQRLAVAIGSSALRAELGSSPPLRSATRFHRQAQTNWVMGETSDLGSVHGAAFDSGQVRAAATWVARNAELFGMWWRTTASDTNTRPIVIAQLAKYADGPPRLIAYMPT